MNANEPTRSGIDEPSALTADRHDARIMLVLVVSAVVFVTIYPLRFVLSLGEFASGLTVLFRHPFDALTPLHLVPAAIMTMLACRAFPARRPVCVAAAVALWLLALELLQPLIQYRHARIGDIAAQWLGVALGWWITNRLPITAASAKRKRWWPRIWLVSLLGTTAFAALVGLRAQIGHDIGPLDPTYRITIGNEVGNERPWLGQIHSAGLYAASVDTRTAQTLASLPIAPDSLNARRSLGPAIIYDFESGSATIAGTAQSLDRGGSGPPLLSTIAVLTADGLDTTLGGPQESRQNVGAFCAEAEAAQAVTIEALVTPASTEQFGPARLVTISNGPNVRNLTLAQIGDDAEVRIRTRRTGANASRVVATFPGVFIAGQRTSIIATTSGDRVRLWVDGVDRGTRYLMVNPGDWLGLKPVWRDLPASAVLFVPIGIAAAGVRRRLVPAVLLGASAASAAALAVLTVAVGLDRPAEPVLVLMAASMATLGAIASSSRTE